MKSDQPDLFQDTDPALLRSLREIAETDGKDLDSVLSEALREYVQRRQADTPSRSEVLGHARDSIERNRRIGELLAP